MSCGHIRESSKSSSFSPQGSKLFEFRVFGQSLEREREQLKCRWTRLSFLKICDN